MTARAKGLGRAAQVLYGHVFRNAASIITSSLAFRAASYRHLSPDRLPANRDTFPLWSALAYSAFGACGWTVDYPIAFAALPVFSVFLGLLMNQY